MAMMTPTHRRCRAAGVVAEWKQGRTPCRKNSKQVAVDDSVAGEEEHRDDRGDGVEVADGNRGEGDEDRDAEHTAVVRRAGADREVLESGDAVAEPLELARGLPASMRCRGERGCEDDRHRPTRDDGRR